MQSYCGMKYCHIGSTKNAQLLIDVVCITIIINHATNLNTVIVVVHSIAVAP